MKNINVTIVIYDSNSNSEKLIKKYNQLMNLGFYNVYIYPGVCLNGYVYKIFMEKKIFQLHHRVRYIKIQSKIHI